MPGTAVRPRQDIVVNRPAGYFDPKGPLPKQATLRLTKLPAYEHLPDEAYVSVLQQAVAQKEAELRAKVYAEGRTFLGAKAVLRQSPFDRPKTHEPRRKISPRVACHNKWARIEALGRLKAFVQRYKEAWQRYRIGQRDVEFPYGTYWLRVYASVPCAPG